MGFDDMSHTFKAINELCVMLHISCVHFIPGTCGLIFSEIEIMIELSEDCGNVMAAEILVVFGQLGFCQCTGS